MTLIFTVYFHVTVLHTACLLKNKSTHRVIQGAAEKPDGFQNEITQ